MIRLGNGFWCLVLGLLVSLPCHAEQFRVKAQVLCPASLVVLASRPDGQKLEAPNETFASPVPVPCAGLRVTARDSDSLIDAYCGAAYTDSGGRVDFMAECSDLGSRPDVYLQVESRSALGFSVGTHSLSFFEWIGVGLEGLGGAATTLVGNPSLLAKGIIDYLRSHETMSWVTSERLPPVPNPLTPIPLMDFGPLLIGGDFGNGSDPQTVSRRAAQAFWITQYSALRIRAGNIRLPDFDFTVDAPAGYPTTLWDTIVIEEQKMLNYPAYVLQATPHEMGHIVYNKAHSNFGEWLTDATDYLVIHDRCDDDHYQTLAWYEGFGNFMSDYVYQRWDWSSAHWYPQTAIDPENQPRPYAGCAFQNGKRGLHIEGNAQALLNAVFFGPLSTQQQAAIALIPQSPFVCPAGARRVVTLGQPDKCEVVTSASCPRDYRLIVDANNGISDICRPPAGRQSHDCDCVRRIPGGPCIRPGPSTCPASAESVSCARGTLRHAGGRDTCLSTTNVSAAGVAPNARPDGSPDLVRGLTPTGAAAWFSLPSLDIVEGWIKAEGTHSRRAGEFWSRQIKPWCTRPLPSGSVRPYCDPTVSASFTDEMRVISDDLP